MNLVRTVPSIGPVSMPTDPWPRKAIRPGVRRVYMVEFVSFCMCFLVMELIAIAPCVTAPEPMRWTWCSKKPVGLMRVVP